MVDEPAAEEEFKSRLASGRQRFLAHVVDYALSCNRRTPDDFIRHFPPAAIMVGLKAKAQLRAKILAGTTGLNPKIAKKKTPESAGEDLQIALDERVTDPETIVSLFSPDDRVRYLDAKALWSFVVEGEFWHTKSDGMEYEIIKSQIAYMLDRALVDSLITHRDIVDGIGVDKIAELLPRPELGWILGVALERGRTKKPFTDADLLGEAPTSVLTDHIPLPDIWDRVIVDKVALVHGFVEAPEPEPAVEEDERKAKPKNDKQTIDDSPSLPDSDEEPTTEAPDDFAFSDETQNGDIVEAADTAAASAFASGKD